MANSNQLSAALAEVLGLTTTSVMSHMRILREKGLVRKAGHGLNAAQMTAEDAALLLVAVGGSPQIKDSDAVVRKALRLKTTRRSSAMVSMPHPSSKDSGRVPMLEDSPWAQLDGLPETSSLVDMIRTAIEIVVGEFEKGAGVNLERPRIGDARPQESLVVQFLMPETAAIVTYWSSSNQVSLRSFGLDAHVVDETHDTGRFSQIRARSKRDLVQVREVSAETIAALAQCLLISERNA